MKTLLAHTKEINEQLARYGVKFGIYKDGTFNERLFPFDPVPRQIPEKDYEVLEKGLIQRVTALNRFIYDIYHDKKIVRDGVVPEEFVYRSPGYLAQCEGITPSKEVYSHISGIDLVEGKDDEWYILEDNLRIPSGASYPLIAPGDLQTLPCAGQPELRSLAEADDGLREHRRHQCNLYPGTLQCCVL